MPTLNSVTKTKTWAYAGEWYADAEIMTDRRNGYATELDVLEAIEGQLRMSLAAVEARAAVLRGQR